ncbi:MAG: hypothetical protein KatS3mg102_1059 [Planctomycetota bacterium]|nr:MAG: hypothetical protein KatS3mg102_1059 [Planctomycetota bacterium]
MRTGGRVLLAAAMAAALCAASSGCVERVLWVRSEPAGARVFLDGCPVGRTPLELRFSYYGTRELVLRAEGHEPARRLVALEPPWYQWPGLDLVAELLVPWTIRDEHRVEVRLAPAAPRNLEAVRERAEAVRASAAP